MTNEESKGKIQSYYNERLPSQKQAKMYMTAQVRLMRFCNLTKLFEKADKYKQHDLPRVINKYGESDYVFNHAIWKQLVIAILKSGGLLMIMWSLGDILNYLWRIKEHKMYIRILENDDWIVEYDSENNRYRVGYFQDCHFVDDVLFDTGEQIPVNERLPEECKEVLITVKDDSADSPIYYTAVGWYYAGIWVVEDAVCHQVIA